MAEMTAEMLVVLTDEMKVGIMVVAMAATMAYRWVDSKVEMWV
jgi:hypothetical protein